MSLFKKKQKGKRSKKIYSIEKQTVMEETSQYLKKLREALEPEKQTA